MRHRNVVKTLGRKAAPRNAMLKQLAASIILHEKVKTTETKAKVVRSLVERSITDGKTPSLSIRRKLLKRFSSEYPVNKILDVLSPRYLERNGGYTRITKIGARKGDGAPVVQIELV